MNSLSLLPWQPNYTRWPASQVSEEQNMYFNIVDMAIITVFECGCLGLMYVCMHADRITGLLMLPHSDGCVVHVCYNGELHMIVQLPYKTFQHSCPGTQLYQWSVKDITRSSSYQSRREGVHSSSHSISCLAGSALCLGSHDPSATESKMSELLVLGELEEGENKWPVEVLVTVGEKGEVTIFNRESYNVLCTSKPVKQDQQDSEYPGETVRMCLF